MKHDHTENNRLTTSIPGELVTLIDGVPMVSSLDIARRFEKRHKDVLKAIRNLECSDEFNRRNFRPVMPCEECNPCLHQIEGLNSP